MYPLFRLWLTSGTIMAEASAVITMRLWGMSGLWRVGAQEQSRMVTEKLAAAQMGALRAGQAALRGAPPVAVVDAALKPVRRATRGNVRRLSGGNPLLPPPRKGH